MHADVPGCNHYPDSPTDVYTPPEHVRWRRINGVTGGRYTLELPLPLANWDVFASWELDRFASMETMLRRGMVLYDVGAEQGWQSATYAKLVGAGNMVLIEPTMQLWPGIRAIWERNCDAPPRLCYDGLAATVTADSRPHPKGWPDCTNGPLLDRNKYTYIHEHGHQTPQMRLDDLAAISGIYPDAMTIDVEGAELEVLRGASWLLSGDRLRYVWVSIHPDLAEKHYGATVDEIHNFMASFGYTGTLLAIDHESHYFYQRNVGV